MLLCPHHHRFFLLHSHSCRKTTVSSSLHHENKQHHEIKQPHENPTASTATPQNFVLRRHNSKSTNLLLQQTINTNQSQQPISLTIDTASPEEKQKLLELSLVAKRTPQFPGSIYVQSSSDVNVASSLPPLRTIFKNNEDEEIDREMILKAVAIRRKVTREIYREAMRSKGKFGITYTTNLADRLGEFLDNVMIEAAALKLLPEFSHSNFNVRAKKVIEDSNVVPLIRWLKHNGLSYPKIAKLICMSKGNLESIRQLTEWLKSIHVKGEFLGVALLKSGDNILERSISELDEIVEYLEINGVKRDWMGFVMSRCPQLLRCNLEELKTRVKFYLNMGMNSKDFGTMVFEFPKVLGYYTLEEMNQKVNYIKEFGLGTEEVGRLLAFKPQLMACSIEERWKPLIKYLYYLGISRDGMKRMLVIKPMVFCVDLEKTIVPKVRFFQDLGIPNNAIGNMLSKFPPLLTYSLYKKIRPVVIFLITRAGVSEKNVGKVIALGPELLGCSIGNKLEVNMKYFLSLGIRLRQLGEMIAEFPMLLRYNIEILRPKYRYLRRMMVRPLQDVIEFPRFFSYSLEGRIVPRYTVMVENRVNFKLRYMLACTDEAFQTRVEDKVQKRLRFEAGIMDSPADDSSENIDGVDDVESVNDFSDLESSDLESDCSDTEDY